MRGWTDADEARVDWVRIKSQLDMYFANTQELFEKQKGWSIARMHRERWNVVCARHELRERGEVVGDDPELDREDFTWLLVDKSGTQFWHKRNVERDYAKKT